jgi:hypothetical protein
MQHMRPSLEACPLAQPPFLLSCSSSFSSQVSEEEGLLQSISVSLAYKIGFSDALQQDSNYVLFCFEGGEGWGARLRQQEEEEEERYRQQAASQEQVVLRTLHTLGEFGNLSLCRSSSDQNYSI